MFKWIQSLAVLILASACLPAQAITAKYYRGAYQFEVSREGAQWKVKYRNDQSEDLQVRRSLTDIEVRLVEKWDGSIRLTLENGIQLFLPPADLDEREIPYREKSQYTRYHPYAQIDQKKLWLAEDRPSFVRVRRTEHSKIWLKNLNVPKGSVVVSQAENVDPSTPTAVLEPINGSEIEDLSRLAMAMQQPIFDRVLEPFQVNAGEEISYRVHEVLSVVEPHLNHQRVWYWVVTTAGKVLTVHGRNGTAVGVGPKESVAQALKRMKLQSPNFDERILSTCETFLF